MHVEKINKYLDGDKVVVIPGFKVFQKMEMSLQLEEVGLTQQQQWLNYSMQIAVKYILM